MQLAARIERLEDARRWGDAHINREITRLAALGIDEEDVRAFCADVGEEVRTLIREHNALTPTGLRAIAHALAQRHGWDEDELWEQIQVEKRILTSWEEQ
jgi:siderophore synthetase component